MSRITIRYDGTYEYDEWLEIRLTGEFAGFVGFYGLPKVFAEFVDALADYPIDPSRPPTFDNGYVYCRPVPIDAVGNLHLELRLGEPFENSDYVRVRLPISYAWLQDFRNALSRFIAAPEEPLEIEVR